MFEKIPCLLRSNAINMGTFDDYFQKMIFFLAYSNIGLFYELCHGWPCRMEVCWLYSLFVFVCFLAMSDDHITAYKANIHIHVWNA